jgi:murein DD-endopeptidase MepM/ murein hydrolase activator NlpD
VRRIGLHLPATVDKPRDARQAFGMVNPVPTHGVGTEYGIRGAWWSCQANAAGGVHTGCDIPADEGTTVVAARPGRVRHVAYGSAFGDQQVAVVVPESAGGGEDFYAHMRSRVADGTEVVAGEPIGTVGARGNTNGPHLHFERHPRVGSWSCDNHADPAPSLAFGPSARTSALGADADDVWEYAIASKVTRDHRTQPAAWYLARIAALVERVDDRVAHLEAAGARRAGRPRRER